MKKQLKFILLNGPMGVGKSTIAKLIAPKLKRTALIKIENIRELVTGVEDNSLAWNVIYRMCDEYFKNGVSVLLEQTVASEEIVNKFLRLAKRHNCNISFYHLQSPRKVLLERIEKRKKVGNAPKSLITSNQKKHNAISYRNASIIDTSEMKSSEVAKVILSNL